MPLAGWKERRDETREPLNVREVLLFRLFSLSTQPAGGCRRLAAGPAARERPSSLTLCPTVYIAYMLLSGSGSRHSSHDEIRARLRLMAWKLSDSRCWRRRSRHVSQAVTRPGEAIHRLLSS